MTENSSYFTSRWGEFSATTAESGTQDVKYL